MSQEQEEERGLPTFKPDHKGVFVTCPECNHDAKEDYVIVRRECTNCDNKISNELVWRTDVAQLIKDKIEDLHELNRGFQEKHRDIPYPVHDHIEQIKEELLEEVQPE